MLQKLAEAFVLGGSQRTVLQMGVDGSCSRGCGEHEVVIVEWAGDTHLGCGWLTVHCANADGS